MVGCWAFQLVPSQVHVPREVTATISCCAGSPAIPDVITCGPLLNVLGFDHAAPVHVLTLPLQHVTRPGAGTFVGIGTGTALGSGAGTTGTGTGVAIAAFAVAFGNEGAGSELEIPDGASTSGHGTATAGDAGPAHA